MALNSSGPISIGGSTAGQSINLEIKRSASSATSLNESIMRGLAGIASGAISLSSFYAKKYWQLVTGSYAYASFTTSRWATTYTWSFGEVKPKTINVNGKITQYDWPADNNIRLEVYYSSSGWVTVYYTVVGMDPGTWYFNFNVACSIDQTATQMRFTANARANGDAQVIQMIEWYT